MESGHTVGVCRLLGSGARKGLESRGIMHYVFVSSCFQAVGEGEGAYGKGAVGELQHMHQRGRCHISKRGIFRRRSRR